MSTPELAVIKEEIAALQLLPIPEHGDSFEEIHNQLSEALTQVEGL